jgi:hypothetical protein
MTIDFTSAQAALDRELVRFDPLANLRDALKDIGGLAQAADEAGKRLEAARAEEATAQADLEAIRLRVANARAAADVDIATASAAADDVITKSKVASAAIIEAAKKQAVEIVEQAKSATADSVRRAAVLADAIKAVGS